MRITAANGADNRKIASWARKGLHELNIVSIIISKAAFNTAVASAGTTCFYTSYQPKLPNALKKHD